MLTGVFLWNLLNFKEHLMLQNTSTGCFWAASVVVGSGCNFIKKRLWHRCFPVNFAKFLRTPFLQNTSGRLLLNPSTIPDINSETNPPPTIINVVCKYLRQVLGTSFCVATLPVCCNIEGPDLFLQSWPSQNSQKFFQKLAWSK